MVVCPGHFLSVPDLGSEV
uniref:Uncharacterized protein n=1 Tax=Arundo donax TaxID=35708 RepID=A0A0A9AX95_ARUDO